MGVSTPCRRCDLSPRARSANSVVRARKGGVRARRDGVRSQIGEVRSRALPLCRGSGERREGPRTQRALTPSPFASVASVGEGLGLSSGDELGTSPGDDQRGGPAGRSREVAWTEPRVCSGDAYPLPGGGLARAGVNERAGASSVAPAQVWSSSSTCRASMPTRTPRRSAAALRTSGGRPGSCQARNEPMWTSRSQQK